MYMDNQKYTIINNTEKDTLKEYCEKNKLNFDLTDNAGQWGAFAHYYGEKKGYTTYKLISFTNMITMLIANTKLEDKSQEFIKESTLTKKILKIAEQIDETKLTDEEKTKELFYGIVKTYDDLNFDSNYAVAKITKTIKFSYDQFEKIETYPGADFSKKIKYIVSLAPKYRKYEK